MKNWLIAFLLIGYSCQLSAIDASVSYATFKSPQQNYVEIYLYIAGRSVTFEPVNDSLAQAQVEVIILFKQEGQIVRGDKYQLSSPRVQQPLDFVDLKRYALDNGTYELAVAIYDLKKADNAKEFETSFVMAYEGEDAVQQSSLQLLAGYERAVGQPNIFVKNGILMEPLPHNFYGRQASALTFYNEVYHTDRIIGEDFLVSYSIEREHNGQVELIMAGHKRQQPQPVVPLLIQMNISKLPSGNYYLVVSIRNRAKELLSSKRLFFQRSNPFFEEEQLELLSSASIEEEFVQKLSPKQLEYSLRALTPVMPPTDVEMVNNLMRTKNVERQRLYLFSYWARESPNNPEFAYKKYMEIAAAIDQQFNSGFRFGFETDRGYIYLKYGRPDDVENRNMEPSAPPYEIWTYFEFPRTGQNNVKFVFYNPSLAPGDYLLLHSTAIGELNNPQWQRQLYRSVPGQIQGSDYFEGTDMMDNINRNAGRIFTDY
jgi:GWxTD domain-containing protein